MASIGNYEIETNIGAGGSGTVYRSMHPVLKRPIAIKVLHDTLADDPDARERFLREARLTMDLSHPGIVKLYDIGQSDGRLYIVMSLLGNGSLADATAGRALPLPEAIAMGAAIAEALAHAHRMGVVHRDVKPSNVLLRDDGAPVLTDFGVAVDRSTTPPAAGGATFGTPAYCAPEQLDGRSVDARSDMYAFGVLVYELIAGRLPFDGSAADVVFHHLRSRPQPLRTIDPGVPLALDALVQQLLAKHPAQRPSSMDDVAAELRTIARQVSASSHSGGTATAGATHRGASTAGPAMGVTTRLPAHQAPVAPASYIVPQDTNAVQAPAPGPLFSPPQASPVATQPSGVDRWAWIQQHPGQVLLAIPLLFLTCMWLNWSLRSPGLPIAIDTFPTEVAGYVETPTPTLRPTEFAVLPVELLDVPPMREPHDVESGLDRWSVGSVGVDHDGASIRVYGVLQNIGERERADAMVRVLLRDGDGNQVASNEARAQRRVLAPGSYSGFSVTLDDGDGTLPPAGQFSTAFEVRSDPPAAASNQARYDPTAETPNRRQAELKLDVQLGRTTNRAYQLVGALTTDERSIGLIQAQAILFDDAGNIVALTTLSADVPPYISPTSGYISPTSGYIAPSTALTLSSPVKRLERQPTSVWVAVDLAPR